MNVRVGDDNVIVCSESEWARLRSLGDRADNLRVGDGNVVVTYPDDALSVEREAARKHAADIVRARSGEPAS